MHQVAMVSHRLFSRYLNFKCVAIASLCVLFSVAGCQQDAAKENSDGTAKKEEVEKKSAQRRADREAELAEARLDKKKQEFIDRSEHITFEIEHVFGDQWKAAFKAKDENQLKKFLVDGIQGSSPVGQDFQTKTASVVTERMRILSDAAAKPAQYDSSGLAAYLKEVADGFEKIERLKFRVLAIDQPVEDQPIWQCRILIDVVGESAPGKPKQYESEQNIVFELFNLAEIDKVPVISEWHIEKEIFRDSERYLTKEVTEDALLHEVDLADNWKLPVPQTEQYWFQYAVDDFDLDGKNDIAIACRMFYPKLLQNGKGNRFVESAAEKNVVPKEGLLRIGTSFGCAWIDYNNDGYPDLVLGDKLYRNEKGLQFVDVTFDSNLNFARECMGILVADYDCDGLLDLYLLYQAPPSSKLTEDAPKQWVNETNTGMDNQLWRNLGNGKFENVTKVSNAGGGRRHTHAAAWFFYDDDRYPDLYIANDFGKNVLLRNKGDGTFEDISEASKVAGYSTSMGVATGDLNNDGKTDIYVANMYSKMGRRIIGQVSDEDYPEGIYPQIQGSCAGNRFYLRDSDDSFKDMGEGVAIHDVGWAFGPTLLDYDGDGLLDIYATSGFMSFDREKPDG